MNHYEREDLRIAAGIVLYHPDKERLRENISAIAPQVEELYLICNGSDSDVEQYMTEDASDEKIFYVKYPENRGIAAALNEIMQQGRQRGMTWVLTLDQDSVCPPDLIQRMIPFALSMNQAAILCPVIADRSFGIEHHPVHPDGISMLKECITSASLTRVSAWEESGGFDDKLFIDSVDTDFCLTLREHGWQIIQINSIQLSHEIGHEATQHIVCGRSYIAFNHVPERYFYMSRNLVYLSRKHLGFLKPAPYRSLLTLLARILVILLWERELKLRKCWQIIRGMKAGCLLTPNQ